MSHCYTRLANNKSIIMSLLLFLYLIFNTSNANAFSLIKGTGAIYIKITNPVEWVTSTQRMWEEQHMTPQYLENDAISSVVLVSRIGHTVSDRWKGKPYLFEHENFIFKLLTLGNANSRERLNAAYRMGCYNFPYALFCFDYRHDTWHLVATELDAPSMFVYGFAYIVNIPQKIINKSAYIATKGTAPSLFTLLDVLVNTVSLLIEIPCAIIGTVTGIFVAFLAHPWDSICSILGMVYMLVFSIFTAILDLLVGLFRLVISPF